MNIKSQIYTIIDELLTLKICDVFNITSIFIFKFKSIRNFNNEFNKRLITYVIYSRFIVNEHTKRTYSMLFIKFNAHKIILKNSE